MTNHETGFARLAEEPTEVETTRQGVNYTVPRNPEVARDGELTGKPVREYFGMTNPALIDARIRAAQQSGVELKITDDPEEAVREFVRAHQDTVDRGQWTPKRAAAEAEYYIRHLIDGKTFGALGVVTAASRSEVGDFWIAYDLDAAVVQARKEYEEQHPPRTDSETEELMHAINDYCSQLTDEDPKELREYFEMIVLKNPTMTLDDLLLAFKNDTA